MARPRAVFTHLERMTDERGLFEHALFDEPRREHGYCVDDVARGLVVSCREPNPELAVQRLAQRYLDFVLSALRADGTCHNRMDADGYWRDTAGVGDWWGRALWGLGIASVSAPTAEMRAQALSGFRLAAQQRSPFSRSMAFAALGAGELLRADRDDIIARDLLRDTADAIGPIGRNVYWPWPEPRLRYANGAVAEALLTAGDALQDRQILNRGLKLLGFLLRTETRNGHLSVTPVGGRGPGDFGPGYDQQPIEVAALADACATAYRITREPLWLTGVSLSWRWFLGDNDGATPMFDVATGGGYDGLTPQGCNLNQGAESTLALLSTAQRAQHTYGLR